MPAMRPDDQYSSQIGVMGDMANWSPGFDQSRTTGWKRNPLGSWMNAVFRWNPRIITVADIYDALIARSAYNTARACHRKSHGHLQRAKWAVRWISNVSQPCRLFVEQAPG